MHLWKVNEINIQKKKKKNPGHALKPQLIIQHGNRMLLISTYSPRLQSEGIKEREREQDITRISLKTAKMQHRNEKQTID